MKLSKEYIAGLFDGEGCIGLHYNKGAASARYKSGHVTPSWTKSLALGSTFKPITQALHKIYGGSHSRRLREGWADGCKRKALWTWRLGAGEDMLRFLQDIEPFLIQKRPEARLMIKYINNPKNREAVAKRLRAMKDNISYPN